jgi:UDP-glucose 4-epimerase
MKLLVVGGAGYIGSHFVKAALLEGHIVTVFDNLQTGHRDAIDPKATFFQGDLRDPSALDSVFASSTFDAVIHFAANSLVAESVKDPLKYFDNNVSGTIGLLQAMNRHQVKQLIFSSSAAVYGSHETMPITEDYATVPTNPYGQTKLMMEQIMRWCEAAYGIRYVSLRYFNVAGSWGDGTIGEDHRPETHLIPIVLQVPLGIRSEVTVFGDDYNTKDGTCIRDYIHVVDLAEAHLKALAFLVREQRSEIFNLGSQEGYSNLEILETARKTAIHPIPAGIGPRRPGDPDKLVASSAKAKRMLGWTPKRGIENIVKDAWTFHQAKPKGYDR